MPLLRPFTYPRNPIGFDRSSKPSRLIIGSSLFVLLHISQSDHLQLTPVNQCSSLCQNRNFYTQILTTATTTTTTTTHARTHAHTRTRTHTHARTHTHTHTHTHARTRTHARTHARTHFGTGTSDRSFCVNRSASHTPSHIYIYIYMAGSCLYGGKEYTILKSKPNEK